MESFDAKVAREKTLENCSKFDYIQLIYTNIKLAIYDGKSRVSIKHDFSKEQIKMIYFYFSSKNYSISEGYNTIKVSW